MSPDPKRGALRVALHAPPADAKASASAIDATFERLLASAAAAAHAEGRRAAIADAAQILEKAGEKLDAAREEATAQVASTAVQLAVGIAQELLRTEIAAGRYDLERIVREALAFSGVGRAPCVVHLHPTDAATLASVRFRAGTAIEADEAVSRGDVHVSTPRGLLVREVDETLRSIRARLREEVSK